MVNFYKGIELSKRLQISSRDKDKTLEYIHTLVELIKLSWKEGSPAEELRKYPLFLMGIRLRDKKCDIDFIEKILRYHILSSDYRGVKFLEELLSTEAVVSYLKGEHYIIIYQKLISYLGEEYIDYDKYSLSFDLYYEYNLIKFKEISSDRLNIILSMNLVQLEYLLFDINPIYISNGIRLLSPEIRYKILSFYNNFTQEIILYQLKNDPQNSDIGMEFIDLLEKRIKGIEKNSFEIRRDNIYYNRLYSGGELTYRLNSSIKNKKKLKDIILIILGVSGRVKENGFESGKNILNMFQSEDLIVLQRGLTFLFEGWHPFIIRFILENYLLSGDFKGIDFLKRYIIMEGVMALSLNISEFNILEKFIQTIGEELREEVESYIENITIKNFKN